MDIQRVVSFRHGAFSIIMHRKRDEALGLQDDTDEHSLSGSSAVASSNRRRRAVHASDAGSLIDSELLTDDKSQSSHLTSNIDSVYSFYNQAGQEKDGSQVTSSMAEESDAKPKRVLRLPAEPPSGGSNLDLQQLMMEIN